MSRFFESPIGRVIDEHLRQSIAAMEAMCLCGIPPIVAVGHEVCRIHPGITDTQRKLVGKRIKSIIGEFGWVVIRRGLPVPVQCGFKKGTSYARPE